jgi:hypothetical protein
MRSIEYEGDVRELYNLVADPYELTNSYNSATPSALATRVQALKSCSGVTCRSSSFFLPLFTQVRRR